MKNNIHTLIKIKIKKIEYLIIINSRILRVLQHLFKLKILKTIEYFKIIYFFHKYNKQTLETILNIPTPKKY